MVVTVEGAQWEISSFTGAYIDFTIEDIDSRFNVLPVGAMPWWQSSALVASFQAVYGATPGSGARLFGFSIGDAGGASSVECVRFFLADVFFSALVRRGLLPLPSHLHPLVFQGHADSRSRSCLPSQSSPAAADSGQPHPGLNPSS